MGLMVPVSQLNFKYNQYMSLQIIEYCEIKHFCDKTCVDIKLFEFFPCHEIIPVYS